MAIRLKQLFVAHPDALGESYLQHMGHAMSYAGRLFGAAFCAFAHGLFPFLFEKNASNAVKAMYGEMTSRGATQALPAEPRPPAGGAPESARYHTS
jgi:Family of unknown function (DUF6356)